MRILIIPDSFKECLKANEVCRSIHKGISEVLPKAEVVKIPFSDGGEGALDVLIKFSKIMPLTVQRIHQFFSSCQQNEFQESNSFFHF